MALLRYKKVTEHGYAEKDTKELTEFIKKAILILEEAYKEEGIEEFVNDMKEEHKSVEQCVQTLKRIYRLADDQAKENMDLYWPE